MTTFILLKQQRNLRGRKMPDNPKTTHGGPGRGGGRPSLNVQRYYVTLDPETVERARALGNGNLSAGIRAALRKK